MKCVMYDLYSVNTNLINYSNARESGWENIE